MIVTYKDDPVFLHSFNYALGGLRRNLDELKDQNLLLGDVATLREAGYEYNFALRSNETLLQLASRPVLETGQMSDGIDAMVFQHCYQESAVLPYAPNEPDVALRNRYFAAEVMRELKLDHLPYLCSFASGCAGFASILLTAAGLFDSSEARSTICVMADSMPRGVPFNMLRERIPPVGPEFGVPPWSRATWLRAAGNQLLLHRPHCSPVCRNRQASSGN